MLGLILPTLLCLGSVRAGELFGSVSADALQAQSRSTESGSGTPEVMTAREVGTRVGLRVEAGRWSGTLDYRGRDALPGDFQNTNLHLFYAANAGTDLSDRWSVSAGRFVAPSVVFLPVDGITTDFEVFPGGVLTAFGGRRGITTSRTNIGFDRFLPAGGAALGWRMPRVDVRAQAAYAVDEALYSQGATDAFSEEYGSLNAMLLAVARPRDELMLGAHTAFVQQASYLLGPTWSESSLSVEALGLFSGLVWADYAPQDWLQTELDVHFQRVGLYDAGIIENTDDGISAEDLEDPTHLDNRVRVGFRPGDLGWVRADVRYRIRDEGNETRMGLRVEADELGITGLYARGYGAIDNLEGGEFVDRLIGSVSTGYRRSELDGQVGVSFIERSGKPWSGRRLESESGEDLAPFVLEAQSVVFLRTFYSSQRWFSGLDMEYSLKDSEFRAMLQAGVLVDRTW